MTRFIVFIIFGLLIFQSANYPVLASETDNYQLKNRINLLIQTRTSYDRVEKSHRVVVLGDSLGDGIWMGLYDAFRHDLKVKIIRHSRVSTGFVSKAFFDWNAQITQIIKSEKPDTLVMLFGTNDIRSMRTSEGYHKFFSRSWVRHYRKRLVEFLGHIKNSGVPSYWVGLPNMRRKRMSESAAKLNNIMRQETRKRGITFIETWSDFSDKNGRFYSYGPDLKGKVRRLRANDGIHFTRIGYRKLAYGVEKALRRQLGQ